MAPLIGFLMDKVGVRKIIIFGIAVSGLGLLLMSRTNSLLFFYSTFLLLSIGTSCGLLRGQYIAVANWFLRKRTWAMGIISAGLALAGFVGPVPGLLLVRWIPRVRISELALLLDHNTASTRPWGEGG